MKPPRTSRTGRVLGALLTLVVACTFVFTVNGQDDRPTYQSYDVPHLIIEDESPGLCQRGILGLDRPDLRCPPLMAGEF
jgi:hypothetical protein